MRRVAQAKLPHISGLVVWTTTELMLREHGSLAPIWSLGKLSNDQTASPSGSRRQLLFHMHTEKEVTSDVVESGGVRSQVTSIERNGNITRIYGG